MEGKEGIEAMFLHAKEGILVVNEKGEITQVINQGRKVGVEQILEMELEPNHIEAIREIGSKFYQKMKPMMDERERVRAEIYKLVAELIPTLNS